jgi:DNA-nicking Smr family endonuclease
VTDDKDHESRVFREAMRGVRRLERPAAPRRVAPKPPPKARFTRADQKEVLRESLEGPIDEATLSTGDELSFRRDHVPESVITRLRRGQFVIGDEIDLHGMTAVEARLALREFVAAARKKRMGCVRVIHGKGRRSGPRGPVLKNVVNQWLRRTEDVLAFASARAVDGGSGAVYVLLSKKP